MNNKTVLSTEVLMKGLYKEYYRLNFGGTKTTTVLKPNTHIIGLLTASSDQWYNGFGYCASSVNGHSTLVLEAETQQLGV
jgi:hypothetical protein